MNNSGTFILDTHRWLFRIEALVRAEIARLTAKGKEKQLVDSIEEYVYHSAVTVPALTLTIK